MSNTLEEFFTHPEEIAQKEYNWIEDQRYHLVYLTTNLINGKIYIGIRSSNKDNDAYLGSGKTFKKAIKKHGKGNFKRQILYYCLSRQDAFDIEEQIVDQNFINRVDTYNLALGGNKGHKSIGHRQSLKTRPFTPEHKKNISLSMIKRGKTVEWKEFLSKLHKGKVITVQAKEKAKETRSKRTVEENLAINKRYSDALIGRTFEDKYGPEEAQRKKENLAIINTGRILSDESKRK